MTRIKEEPREVPFTVETEREPFIGSKNKGREISVKVEEEIQESSHAIERNISAARRQKRSRTRAKLPTEEPPQSVQETTHAVEEDSRRKAAHKRKKGKRSAEADGPHTAEKDINPVRKPEEREPSLSPIAKEEENQRTWQTAEENNNTVCNEKRRKRKFKPIDIANALPWHRRFVFSNEHIEDLKNKNGIELKRGRFTEEEDARIKKNWKAYSSYYNVEYFDVFLNGRQNREASRFIKETHMYAELARKLSLRTARSVFDRARVILNPHYSLRRPYTESEDERIKELREIYGKNWTIISSHLERTPNSLSQHSARMVYKRGPFTVEEKNAIFDWVRKTYGVEEVHTVPSKDIDLERMRHEAARNRCTQQLRDFWAFFVSKASLDEARKREIYRRLLDRLEQSSAKKEIEVPWSQIASELSCDERFLRRKFTSWKSKLDPASRSQSIAAIRISSRN